MNHSFALCIAAVFTLGAGIASAEKADRNKPMNVEADALRHDDLGQTSVFTGRVVLTKGTIVIRGDRLEVRQDAEGYQFGRVTVEAGKNAFFRQKREGVDEYIEGEGEVIEYDGRADNVKFIRHAQLRRLRGATLADEVSGEVIHYDNLADVFTVDGGPVRPGSTRGRVRAMLTPKPEPAAPGAESGSGARPALRPSPSLGGKPQ